MEPSAILGAAVALTIFAATQYIGIVRSRRTVLQGKLEDLLKSFDEIAENAVNLIYRLEYDRESLKVSELHKDVRAITRTMYYPNTLIEVYFPYLEETWLLSNEGLKHTLMKFDRMMKEEEIDYLESCYYLADSLQRIYWVRKVISLNVALFTKDMPTSPIRFLRRTLPWIFKMPVLELPDEDDFNFPALSDLDEHYREFVDNLEDTD